MLPVKNANSRTLYNAYDYLTFFRENQTSPTEIHYDYFENDVFVKPGNDRRLSKEEEFSSVVKIKRKRKAPAKKRNEVNKENIYIKQKQQNRSVQRSALSNIQAGAASTQKTKNACEENLNGKGNPKVGASSTKSSQRSPSQTKATNVSSRIEKPPMENGTVKHKALQRSALSNIQAGAASTQKTKNACEENLNGKENPKVGASSTKSSKRSPLQIKATNVSGRIEKPPMENGTAKHKPKSTKKVCETVSTQDVNMQERRAENQSKAVANSLPLLEEIETGDGKSETAGKEDFSITSIPKHISAGTLKEIEKSSGLSWLDEIQSVGDASCALQPAIIAVTNLVHGSFVDDKILHIDPDNNYIVIETKAIIHCVDV